MSNGFRAEEMLRSAVQVRYEREGYGRIHWSWPYRSGGKVLLLMLFFVCLRDNASLIKSAASQCYGRVEAGFTG